MHKTCSNQAKITCSSTQVSLETNQPRRKGITEALHSQNIDKSFPHSHIVRQKKSTYSIILYSLQPCPPIQIANLSMVRLQKMVCGLHLSRLTTAKNFSLTTKHRPVHNMSNYPHYQICAMPVSMFYHVLAQVRLFWILTALRCMWDHLNSTCKVAHGGKCARDP